MAALPTLALVTAIAVAAFTSFALCHAAAPTSRDLLPFAGALLFYSLYVFTFRPTLLHVRALGEVALAPSAVFLPNPWAAAALIAGASTVAVWFMVKRSAVKVAANSVCHAASISAAFWLAAAIGHSSLLRSIAGGVLAVLACLLVNHLTLLAIVARATHRSVLSVYRERTAATVVNGAAVAVLGAAAVTGMWLFPSQTLALMAGAGVVAPLSQCLVASRFQESRLRAALDAVGPLLNAETAADAERILVAATQELTGSHAVSLVHQLPPDGLPLRWSAIEVPVARGPVRHLLVEPMPSRRLHKIPAASLRSLASAAASAFDEAASRRDLIAAVECDPLTGLFNRATFDSLVGASLSDPRRQGGATLCFIDLDGFKQVNDQLGHEAGDQVLRMVAGALKQTLRDGDVVARRGGDEFSVYLPNRQPAPNGDDEVAARIAHAVRSACATVPGSERVSASVGIARFPDDGEDLATLLRTADSRMYQAKRGQAIASTRSAAARYSS